VLPTADNRFDLDVKAMQRVLFDPRVRDRHVVVLSIAGVQRLGKSFILNYVIRYLKSEVQFRDAVVAIFQYNATFCWECINFVTLLFDILSAFSLGPSVYVFTLQVTVNQTACFRNLSFISHVQIDLAIKLFRSTFCRVQQTG